MKQQKILTNDNNIVFEFYEPISMLSSFQFISIEGTDIAEKIMNNSKYE